MHFNPLAFIELFVVLAFMAAWGILELVARRLDRKRPQNSEPSGPASGPERETDKEERP